MPLMADFALITARLAVGVAPSGPQDVAEMQGAGVTHVAELRAEADCSGLLASGGMAWLRNAVPDDGLPKPDSWHQANLDFARDAFSEFRTCVLYCCGAGASRAPSAAYGVIRACWGLPPDAARTLILAVRPQATITYAADFERFWEGR